MKIFGVYPLDLYSGNVQKDLKLIGLIRHVGNKI